MDVTEKERIIAQIIWGYISVTVLSQDNMLLSLLLRIPTPKEQAKAATIYSCEYRYAINRGLSTEDAIIDNMITLSSWSHKKDLEIEGLQQDIHNIRRGLLDFLFNKTRLEQSRTLLRRAESALYERLAQKHSLTNNSAEAHALICQQRYLISCITETEDGNAFWPTENDFEEFADVNIIIQLCDMFFKQSSISTINMRELARSQQWRVYWEIAKHTNDLFDGPITLWSTNQRDLAHWSTIYDSVYNAFERPSKDIIIDDDLLDSWFIRQSEKNSGKTDIKLDKQSGKDGRSETFIMADRDGAKRVYEMNDLNARSKIKARQKILSQQNVVREQDMPDSKMEMQRQLMTMRKKHIKSISRK